MALALGSAIAKRPFAAALRRGGHGQALGTFPNPPEGFAALGTCPAALPPGERAAVRLVMEPTGGYELPLAYWAHAQGWRGSLPNPRQVRDWAHGLGRRAKTDAQDALTLARYGAERQPPAWQPLPAEIAELESLLRRKDDLERVLRQERNRKQSLGTRPHVGVVGSSVDWVIEALEQELTAIKETLQQHLRTRARLQQTV